MRLVLGHPRTLSRSRTCGHGDECNTPTPASRSFPTTSARAIQSRPSMLCRRAKPRSSSKVRMAKSTTSPRLILHQITADTAAASLENSVVKTSQQCQQRREHSTPARDPAPALALRIRPDLDQDFIQWQDTANSANLKIQQQPQPAPDQTATK